MGFFFAQSAADARNVKRGPREVPVHLMKEQGCRACPLNVTDNRRKSPKLEPRGAERPLIYVLGSFPTEDEDNEGQHLDGDVLETTRTAIPVEFRRHEVRFGHAVRCRPVGGEVIDVRASSCCAGLAEADIERSQPAVVMGLGYGALRWALGDQAPRNFGDLEYRGRMWPIKVGEHVCWYFHCLDPQWVWDKQKERKYDTEHTKALRHDIKRLCSMVSDGLPEPVWVDEEERMRGVEIITGQEELHYEHLAQFLDDARKAPLVGLDIETTGLRPYAPGARILTCALSIPKRTLAFPVQHPQGWPESLHRNIMVMLYDFLVESHRKTCHHLGFELEWFGYFMGPDVLRLAEWTCSYAAAHTLDERPGVLSLGATTLMRFGFNVKKMSNLDTSRLLEYPIEDVLVYNALDAKWGRLLTVDLEREISKTPAYVHEYERKVRLAPALDLTQLKGVLVDVEYAEQLRDTLKDEAEAARRLLKRSVEVQKFERKLGREFQLKDEDVVALVRDIMGRPEGQQDNGSYSCDESVLSSIPKEAGIAPHQILVLRGAEKLLGTYVEPVISGVTAKGTVMVWPDGHLHPVFNSMVAETGRLASEDPNGQNWPKRKRKEVRGVVVCPSWCVIAALDYGQIEARVFGMATEDDNLVNALWTDFDIHGHWATRLEDVYPECKDWVVETFEVDWDEKGHKTLRQEMKNKWVFPQFFGSAASSCARNLHIPDSVADQLAAEFWDQYPKIKAWQKRLVQKYERDLYVETLTGRRRRGPLSLNQIINTPIQGTAADLVTDAHVRISEIALCEQREQFIPRLNIHDDLSFYIPKESLVEDVERIAYEMCNLDFDFINVPILVEASVSRKRWHELEEIGVYRSDVLGIHTR